MSSSETNSEAPVNMLNKAEKDLDAYAEKIGDFGYLSMTVGGAAVIGIGQSDAFKDYPDIQRLLVVYTFCGLIAYEIAKGRQYRGYVSWTLLVIGNVARMATLITSISAFLFPGIYVFIAFLLSFTIVAYSVIIPMAEYCETIRKKSLLKSTELLQNENRLDSQNELIRKRHESEKALTTWLEKTCDCDYGYIIAKGVGVLASWSKDTFKDYPYTAYYLFAYTTIGLISYEVAKNREYKGSSQWLVLLGALMRVAIMIMGTLHFIVPEHEWIALFLSFAVVAGSTTTTFIEYKKKISLHNVKSTLLLQWCSRVEVQFRQASDRYGYHKRDKNVHTISGW